MIINLQSAVELAALVLISFSEYLVSVIVKGIHEDSKQFCFLNNSGSLDYQRMLWWLAQYFMSISNIKLQLVIYSLWV